MANARTVVVGLGIMGGAALYHLARRGIDAIGIEQFDIGHDRGSSHGPTRIIRLAHFEAPHYVPLMQRAYALWRELESVADTKLLHITGILEIGPADGAIILGTRAAAGSHDLLHEALDAATMMRRFPAFRLPKRFVGIWQPQGGYIEAAKALEATVAAAVSHGARVVTNEKVLAINARSDGVAVTTSRATIEADGAVVAAGPWMRELVRDLLPDFGRALIVTRQVTCWFEPQDATLLSPDRFPVFILESEHGAHYGFPARGEMGIKIAKHWHLGEIVDDPGDYDRNVHAQDEVAVRAPLADYLPAANGTLLSAQTCLYTTSSDDEFVVDRVPGFPQVVIASACCGRGFKFAPVIGEMLADLVTGRTPRDAERFRLRAFSARV